MTGDPSRCGCCPIERAVGEAIGSRCPLLCRTFRVGAVIYREGAPAERFWYVAEGAVRLSRASGDPPDRVVRSEVLGLEALTRGCRHLDTARAEEKAHVCSAPRAAFEEWLRPQERPLRAALREILVTCAGGHK